MTPSQSRRRFLGAGVGVLALSRLKTGLGAILTADDGQGPDRNALIGGIERSLIFSGRHGGVSWFHPRACVILSPDGPELLMTLQKISGSDVFGPVHWTTSKDPGRTWTDPQPIPGLGRRSLGDAWEVGVCDVVPEYHAPTKTVLAVGHNVYYKNDVLARPQRQRWPVFVVRSPDGHWSEPKRLEWDDPRGSEIYTCGCSQRVTQPNGDVVVPLSFGSKGKADRSVTTVICGFDGSDLRVKEAGTELTNRSGRGLLEPSLCVLDCRTYLTIRAEDGRGYVSVSDDGLAWKPPLAWAWDDGEPLSMSTTQQHWLIHSDALFLVYTRKAAENADVMRWRAPLYLAEVDRDALRLIRSSERVVLPMLGADAGPKHVALMGNFHTTAVTPEESWVTVGEHRPHDAWRGDTLLARIRWNQPNRLAPRP
ncbi:MAG: sialidase family protein, partial [Isosphaeraceae bacterium]